MTLQSETMKFIQSKLLKETYETNTDGLQDVIVTDTRELFKLSIEKIVKKYERYFNQIPYFKNVNVVYYPGSGPNMLEMMMYTNCSTLICTDLVDPYFFPTLEATRKFNTNVEYTLEFSEIFNHVYYFHQVYSRYIPDKVKEKIKSIEVNKNKCIIKFFYNEKLRTLIVYLNMDANKFIPTELKSVDLLVESGFVLSDKMRTRINPKMVLSESGNQTRSLHQNYNYKQNIYLEFPYFYKDLIETDVDFDNKIFSVHKALLFDKIIHRNYILSSNDFIKLQKIKTPSKFEIFKTNYTEDHLDKVLDKQKYIIL